MATNITQTTLSGSINQNATVINVASATNLTAPVNNFPQNIYVINPDSTRGEIMQVTAVSGTQISVFRSSLFRQSFYTGATILIAPVDTTLGGFQDSDPVGSATVTGSYPAVPVIVPWVNTTNGNQWLQGINGIWVPGWNNPTNLKGVTAAVASVAGPITPSGPLFHITGASAITGITKPVGFAGGSFKVIPDGTFTWTTGDASIAIGGTAVVNKVLEFTYDSNAGTWAPSYLA